MFGESVPSGPTFRIAPLPQPLAQVVKRPSEPLPPTWAGSLDPPAVVTTTTGLKLLAFGTWALIWPGET